MTKIKTRDLEGAALDWAVASIEHPRGSYLNEVQIYRGNSNAWWTRIPDKKSRRYVLANYSTNWNQAGPIIERQGLTIIRCDDDFGIDEKGFCNNIRIPVWAATSGQHTVWHNSDYPMFEILESDVVFGPTPLVAAMRCFVLSKMGEEVDLPDELIGGKP